MKVESAFGEFPHGGDWVDEDMRARLALGARFRQARQDQDITVEQAAVSLAQVVRQQSTLLATIIRGFEENALPYVPLWFPFAYARVLGFNAHFSLVPVSNEPGA
jgi:hypothetical protein